MSDIKPYSPFKKVGTSITPKVSGDALDATIIGSTTPASGAFTQLKGSINTETLAANKTLATSDKTIQWLDPNGADRKIIAPSEAASANLIFIILNTADGAGERLLYRNSADTETIATLAPGMGGIFSCNGTAWKWENERGIYCDKVSGNTGIGTTSPAQKLDLEKGHIRLGQVASPSAPTVEVGAAGVLTGNYYYRISFVTALGETESGTVSALVAPSSQQVNLSAIPVSTDSAVTARKIYRTTAGGSTTAMKLVTTINDNTTTTYTDNIADGSLGVSEPRVNSTGGLIFNGTVRVGIIDNATTSIGIDALRVNTGYSNSAMGTSALYSNTTGYSNSAIGANALRANTSGHSNLATGVSALRSNTTGYSNSAIGSDTLRSNTSGYSNSAMGTSALYSNTTGYSNSAIGVNAGRYLADGSTANETSNNSVFLGQGTRANAAGQTNEIVIGASAIGAGSNSVVLGNDSITKTLLKGNVGIGKSPGYQLELSTDSAGKPSTNTWTIVSDERLKKDIKLADLDRCYEIVKTIPLKRFTWRDEVYTAKQVPDRSKLGWISQDVRPVFNKAVDINRFEYVSVEDGVEKCEEQDYTVELVEVESKVIEVIDGKPIQVVKLTKEERKTMLFDEVKVVDEEGNIVSEEDGTPLLHQMPRMIKKTRPKYKKEVIEDCLGMNADQIYAAMYGCLQKVMQKVDSLEEKVYGTT